MTTNSAPQMSPPSSLTVRAEHFVSPAGHRLNSWAIVDGATVVATMKDLGPGTEALAYKLAASLDMLAVLKEATPNVPPVDAICHVGITTQDNCGHCSRIRRAHAVIAKAEHARHEGGPYVRV